MKKLLIAVVFVTAVHGLLAQTPNCDPPQAICNNAYTPERRAIVRITLVGSTGPFTGVLINNDHSDGRNLVLTTALPFNCHRLAGFNPINAGTVISTNNISFLWDDDLTTCNGSLGGGTVTTGATLLDRDESFALLELNSNPPIGTPVYLGWDGGTAISTSTHLNCIFQSFNTNSPKGILTASSNSAANLLINCASNDDFAEDLSGLGFLKITEWDASQPTIFGRGAPLFFENQNRILGIYLIGNENTTDCPGGPSYFRHISQMPATMKDIIGISASQPSFSTAQIEACPGGLDQILTAPQGQNLLVQVTNTIVSTQVVSNGVSVTYQAGRSVTLNPGFVSGTHFIAEIEYCPTTVTIINKQEETASVMDIGSLVSLNKPKVYPSFLSAGDDLHIKLSTASKGLVQVVFTNAIGQVMARYLLSNSVFDGLYKLAIPQAFTKGMYFIHLRSDEVLLTSKIIVQ